MIENQNLSNRFAALVGLPDFLDPWVGRFYEPREIELVLLMGRDTLNTTAVQTRWSAAPDCNGPRDVETFLKRSFKRGVLQRDDGFQYTVADFHTRYDIWALFESWQDIPDDIRDLLNQWEIKDYQSQHLNRVEALRQGNPRDTTERWPEYLLLHEAEALIDAVEHVYLWPCNCRAMIGKCRKPIYTCLRFSNNRDIGWEISKSRAREIIKDANHKGLMQSGEISVMPDGAVGGALCNCCADCCFPHLLARELHAEKLWPLTRYLAKVDEALCTACGRCVNRCPFEAIAIDTPDEQPPETENPQPSIHFNADLCRGCGVCSTGCREGAISMFKLEGMDSLFDKLAI